MENLRKLREREGLTQLQLQIKTGIEQSLLSKYESGTRVPSVENLIILADFFETSIDYLLGRTNAEKLYKGDEEEPKIKSIDIISLEMN